MFDFIAIHTRRNRKRIGLAYHVEKPQDHIIKPQELREGADAAEEQLHCLPRHHYPANPVGIRDCLDKVMGLSRNLSLRVGICPMVRERFKAELEGITRNPEQTFVYISLLSLFGNKSRRLSDGCVVGEAIERALELDQQVVLDFEGCEPSHHFFVTALAPFIRLGKEDEIRRLLILHNFDPDHYGMFESGKIEADNYHKDPNVRDFLRRANPGVEEFLG